jgi:hypothetical protein
MADEDSPAASALVIIVAGTVFLLLVGYGLRFFFMGVKNNVIGGPDAEGRR